MLRAGLGGGRTQDLQTKLPDFTASSLCLWTGMGLRAPPAFHHLEAAPCPQGSLTRDSTFLALPPPPSLCCLCFILILLLEGVASTPSPFLFALPGGAESTPEPGGWAWPCTDVSCILQEKGSKSRERGAEALSFSLCLPPALPWCQIAITSSWNCSVASRSVPDQPWESWG